MQEELKALEEFIYDNEELEQLELMINDFNIFTALNIVNNELRHSNFLSWLLNPKESHSIGDYFLKSLIKRLSYKFSGNAAIPSIFDIDGWSFEDAEVMREWRNIDILIKSDANNFIWIIENKVYSKEHSNQLARYKDIVQKEYPDYKYKVFTYLTIEGEDASDDDYISLSYDEVITIIEKIINDKKDKLATEILTFLSHYTEMVRRYIMREAEIQRICERIYKTHKKALDLIFEYKPDNRMDISDKIQEMISNDSDMLLDSSDKKYIRFIPKELDFIPNEAIGWTKSNRILLFEIRNNPNSIELYLMIGPGNQELREELYRVVQNNPTLFSNAIKKLSKTWFTCHKTNILRYEEEDYDVADILDGIVNFFNRFKKNQLQDMINAFVSGYKIKQDASKE